MFNLIFKVMNTKSKTFYDIVPKNLESVVVCRFKSHVKAIEYMRENHLDSSWAIVPITIAL